MAERYFEPAETQYNEFKGTSAFDEHETRIEEVLELPDKYLLLGFSVFGGAKGGGDALGYDATAYVVELSTTDVPRLTKTVPRGGTVPVIEIHTLVPTRQVLELFKRFSIHAVRNAVDEYGWSLKIERSIDLGEHADDILMEAEQLIDEAEDDDT